MEVVFSPLDLIGVGWGIARAGVRIVGKEAGKAAERYSARTLAKIERQLKEHGRESLERSRRTFQRKLEQHHRDLERYRAEGGYTSSIEREIRAFESELNAIEDVLRGLE
jgi:uncharacterized protein Yka (UPF0111/DUF47 family)